MERRTVTGRAPGRAPEKATGNASEPWRGGAQTGKRTGVGSVRSKPAQPAKETAQTGAPTRVLELGLDPATARRAIILSEIIGPPVSKRHGQKRR